MVHDGLGIAARHPPLINHILCSDAAVAAQKQHVTLSNIKIEGNN